MNIRLKRLFGLTICGSVLAGLLAGYAIGRTTTPAKVKVLLNTGETIIKQKIAYPAGTPNILAAIVTMQPGGETGLHRHDVPVFAHMLEGELTVDYGPDGKHVYHTGDTFLEAFRTPHNGINTGNRPARVLAVFIGAKGAKNTITGK